MIGTTVGNYRITAKLGQGGMGVVYEAEDLRLQRTVALKFLPEAGLDQSGRQRFRNEALSAARIHHPNVCPIYAIEETGGQIFISMAKLEGETVTARLNRTGPLPVEEALLIAAQAAKGLDQAHRMGIVHRDIKAGNIVVSEQGHASILDFGLALASGLNRLTQDGGSVGTLVYMSPEQASGAAVDERSDIWSLGVVLYEMLLGGVPFDGDNPVAVANAIVQREPASLSELRPEIPRAVEQAVLRALAKDPGERWQSAAAMGQELERLAHSSRSGSLMDPALAETRVLPAAVAARSRQKRGLLPVVVGAVLVCVLAAAAYWRWKQPSLPEEKQVAVLPLSVDGGDAEVRALADGLVETLTAQLTELEQFRKRLMVVPASEIRARSIASAADARRVYGANLVIAGSVRRWDERIQISLTLVDAARLRQLAARTIEYDSRNAAALRNEAVEAASRLLSIELTGQEQRAVSSGAMENPGSYSDYLKGRGYLARYDQVGNIDRAITSLESAVRGDSGSAIALTALAEAYWRKASSSGERRWADLAQETAEKAVGLSDILAPAHVRLGEIYSERGRRGEAINQLNRALELAPGNPEALGALADLYSATGRPREAENAYLEAARRRPTDWYAHTSLGIFYAGEGRFSESEAALKAAARLTPDNTIVYRNLAGVYLRQGRYRESREQIERSLKLEPTPRNYSTLGVALYYEGRLADAAAALESAIDLDSGVYTFWGNLGTVYRHLSGSKVRARPAFQRAIELGEKALEVAPADGNLLSNLAEYWAKLGEAPKALAYIDRIPVENRSRYRGRLILVYELAGKRQEAIEAARGAGTNPGLVNSIKDDPDLAELWRDAGFQRSLATRP